MLRLVSSQHLLLVYHAPVGRSHPAFSQARVEGGHREVGPLAPQLCMSVQEAAWRALLSDSEDEQPVCSVARSKVNRVCARSSAEHWEGEEEQTSAKHVAQCQVPPPSGGDGPAGWIERLRAVANPEFEKVGSQRRMLTIGTACSGSGCPTVALQASFQHAYILLFQDWPPAYFCESTDVVPK